MANISFNTTLGINSHGWTNTSASGIRSPADIAKEVLAKPYTMTKSPNRIYEIVSGLRDVAAFIGGLFEAAGRASHIVLKTFGFSAGRVVDKTRLDSAKADLVQITARFESKLPHQFHPEKSPVNTDHSHLSYISNLIGGTFSLAKSYVTPYLPSFIYAPKETPKEVSRPIYNSSDALDIVTAIESASDALAQIITEGDDVQKELGELSAKIVRLLTPFNSELLLDHVKVTKLRKEVISCYAKTYCKIAHKLDPKKSLKALKEAFSMHLNRAQGKYAAECVHAVHTVDGGVKIKETMQSMPTSWSIPKLYLEQKNKEGKTNAEYALNLSSAAEFSGNPGAIRVSASKKDPTLQAYPTNAHRQQIQIEEKTYTAHTSGAFAVHTKITDPAVRQDMALSQALAVVADSFVETLRHHEKARETTLKTGEFLFQASCLVSTIGPEEKMIKDMHLAMQQLGKFSIQFGSKQKIEKKPDGTYVLTLIKPKDIKETFSSPIKMTPVFYTLGVNEFQSLAQITGHTQLQYDINLASWNSHRNYLRRALVAGVELSEEESKLIIAIDELIKDPKSKNIGLLYKLTDLTNLIGGGNLTVCKSGKDRTGMKATHDMMRNAQRETNISDTSAFLHSLRNTGTRIENVRRNTGVPTYAFNEAQVATLPRSFKPSLDYIGGLLTHPKIES